MMMLKWKGKQLSQEILNNIQLVTTVHEWHACFSLFCYDECQNLNLTLTSKAHKKKPVFIILQLEFFFNQLHSRMSQVKLDLLNLYCFHFLKSIIYTTVYNDILCVSTPLDQYHDNVLHAMMTD